MERRLHRGLEALMGTGKAEPSAAPQALQSIPIESIRANPRQPRRHFDPVQLQELSDSIRLDGLLQPIVVRRVDGGFELIAGERRWRACKALGMGRIPAVIRNAEEDQQLVLALVENLQRADLNPIEEGMAIRRLLDEFQLTHDEVARRVGKERSTVTNAMRLLDLPLEVKEAVSRGTISAGHGRALLPLAGTPTLARIFRQVVADGLNVRQTERMAKDAQAALNQPSTPDSDGETSTGSTGDANLADLETRLRERYGVRATVSPRRRGGVIAFHCASREELDHLLASLLASVSLDEDAAEFHV